MYVHVHVCTDTALLPVGASVVVLCCVVQVHEHGLQGVFKGYWVRMGGGGQAGCT